MPTRRLVCSLDELPPGGMKLVDVGKFGVGVYNVRGALYAIVNYCSHEGAPLCLGLIGGTNESAPESSPAGYAACVTGRLCDALGTIGNSTSRLVKTLPTRHAASAPTRSMSATGRCT